MKSRTKARGIALQALYELDLTEHEVGIILGERFQSSPLEENLVAFTFEIVRGIKPIRELLDSFIAEHAPAWPIDQVSIIDKNILRIALWEIALADETPIKVAINEAVELAKIYGSDSTPRFVNGVLGSLAERENEIKTALIKYLNENKLN